MRNKTIIALFMFTIVFAMASINMPLPKGKNASKAKPNTVDPDTITYPTRGKASKQPVLHKADTSAVDTTQMDSLQRSIYLHNKAVDDSIRADSIMRMRSNGINSPVNYAADDSIVYNAKTGTAYLYGNSKVDYENMKLKSDRVSMNMDSSLVRAMGTIDSTAEGGVKGKPVFNMGSDEYTTDSMAFNFKSKKGLIKGIYTHQEEGYLSGEVGKRDSLGVIYLQHGRYTTCDKPHPDFYIALSRAKVRPGKDVVFGPAYLVVADVPLPLAIPYGFFPFSKKYSSGLIMPSYGEEYERGFYLRDGGYYFAINDKWDLKLLGEIYTQGSWGVSVASNYRKRYRYAGSFLFSYQDTRLGDKGFPDYSRQESFKLQWSHRQDAKANPFSSLSASVNFASSSYERNNLNSMYNPQTLTQSTRTSSVSYSTGFSSIGLSLSATANLSQNMRDSMIALTLPDINLSISRFYPFKRKYAVGKERWYEKISMSYTGQLSNSINTKEDRLFKSNLIRDWKNAFQHSIPIQGNFTLFNYINITPSFQFTDRMYSNKVTRSWDNKLGKEVADTTYGFHNVYNWSLNLGLSTKLYGFYIPNRKIFGSKIIAVRHVITPTVSFSYSPNFGARRYGYWDSYQKTDAKGNVTLVDYSPYQDQLYGVPGKGKSGLLSWDVSNNVEMKVRSDKDSLGYKKVSIIDELGFAMSYNAAAEVRRWSDLTMRLRLKLTKSYTFSMNARFATYAWEVGSDGSIQQSNHTELHFGRMPRFQGFSQNISYTLSPEKIKKLFNREERDNPNDSHDDGEGVDTNIESNIDDTLEKGKHKAKQKGGNIAETDEDGYMKFNMPWSLTFGYGVTMREDVGGKFLYDKMRYAYKFSQTLNVSGNIRISDGWNINFSSGYDFDNHRLSMTTASLSRDLHCFNMSASVVLAPYTSYNFTFRANASTLTDALKYDKHSGFSQNVQWY
ncbi:MAG: putative LPS assembly protein LptD [Prevotella bivia]|uniref:LPS-assembly protein LptD central domain-containing protein n=1 Tax=Prevotella bivia TaxID=28125 RepID=A0A137SSI5_9BACT|nr:putative LPS assembly protein LptD [Prevotella bivia]KXO15349.1 hypothetical protein HMPREF3202_01876 [Prevotella bivia]MDU2114013.1 putative LPS assembly protein LptD [Prevotella bivia]